MSQSSQPLSFSPELRGAKEGAVSREAIMPSTPTTPGLLFGAVGRINGISLDAGADAGFGGAEAGSFARGPSKNPFFMPPIVAGVAGFGGAGSAGLGAVAGATTRPATDTGGAVERCPRRASTSVMSSSSGTPSSSAMSVAKRVAKCQQVKCDASFNLSHGRARQAALQWQGSRHATVAAGLLAHRQLHDTRL